MKTRIQKWGNSLGLRIPKVFAQESQIDNKSLVEISVVDGKIVVVPLKKSKVNLSELLSRVTKKNKHHEVDMGASKGLEAW